MDLGEAIDRYLRWRGSTVDAATAKSERAALMPFLRVIGPHDLSEVSPALIQHFRMEVEAAGVAPAYANKVRQRLQAFFAWAEKKKLGSPPVSDLMHAWRTVTVPTADRQRLTGISVADWPIALDMAGEDNPRNRAALALHLYASLRPKQIQSLRVGDVDLGARTIALGGRAPALDISPMLTGELYVWFACYQE